MKCTNCGRQVDDGKVFCPSCGKEIQIVPDYNAFEDDFLRELMEEENQSNNSNSNNNPNADSDNKQRSVQAKKKKIIMISSISIAVVLLIAAIFIAIAVKKAQDSKSFDYQYVKGHEAFLQQDYRDAIEYLEKAIRIDSSYLPAQEELLQCYMKLATEDYYNSAIILCNDIIQADASNELAYKSLIKIYDERKDYKEIEKLAKSVTDANVLSLFADFIATTPIFDNKGGDYVDEVTIKLSCAKNCKIYYTTDGSDPVKKGTEYTNAIVLDKSGEIVIKAVCKNDKGLYSEVLTETYNISFAAPDMPVVTPDGGPIVSSDTLITVEVPDNCIAYYTWDGSDPVPGSSSTFEYTEPIPVKEGNNVLSVILYNEKLNMESPIYRGNFLFYQE